MYGRKIKILGASSMKRAEWKFSPLMAVWGQRRLEKFWVGLPNQQTNEYKNSGSELEKGPREGISSRQSKEEGGGADPDPNPIPSRGRIPSFTRLW